MAAIELPGGAAIKVCPMPQAALTVEGRTLAAPARPPAAEKDDIDSYNAKMLNIMQAAFKKVVQAKSDDMVPVTPAAGTCASLPPRFSGVPGRVYRRPWRWTRRRTVWDLVRTGRRRPTRSGPRWKATAPAATRARKKPRPLVVAAR